LKEKVEQNEQVVVTTDEERNAECWLARESGRQLNVPGVDAVIREGEPVHDRGSSFVARAVRIALVEKPGMGGQLEEVEKVVEKILDTLRGVSEIARTAHPCVYAWRCRIGNDVHTGEFIFFMFTCWHFGSHVDTLCSRGSRRRRNPCFCAYTASA
jgi:hypothetical protein